MEITGRCKYVADTGMRRSRNRTERFSYGWYVASLRQDEIRSVEGGSCLVSRRLSSDSRGGLEGIYRSESHN